MGVLEYNLSMKILILAPLFPPDTGYPASYTKELATRLAAKHETKLLMYGHLPEAVLNCTIEAVDKRNSVLVRVFLFTKALFLQPHFDVLIVNNAPSIELPLFIFCWFKNCSYVLIESDPLALQASTKGWYKLLHTHIKKQCVAHMTLPAPDRYEKADILPFTEYDNNKEQNRQNWWAAHLKELLS